MIKLNNISAIFNPGTTLERRALQDINLTIPSGQFLTVIGSNGAGKSTLLAMITGTQSPTYGQIYLNDKDVTSWSVEKRALHVARVFQDPLEGTCGALTVEENLALAAKRGQRRGLLSATSVKTKREYTDILATLKLGIENHLDQPIGSLSGGQRQAISLLMAIMSPMEILILDEHTAALDPRTAGMIINLTRQIVTDKQLTVLMVTHSMHQALEVGDRTIMLNNGEIIKDLSDQERQNLSSEDLLKLFEKFDH